MQMVDAAAQPRPSTPIDAWREPAQDPVGDEKLPSEQVLGRSSVASKKPTVNFASGRILQEDLEVHPMELHVHLKPGEDITNIHPFEGMIHHLLGLLTPGRAIAVFVFILLSIILTFTVDPNIFRTSVTMPNVRDEAGCLALCEKTKTDDKFAGNVGGKGDCSTVSFKLCDMSLSKLRKFKTKDCEKLGTEGDFSTAKCKFEVVPPAWHPYATISVFALAVIGCFQQGPPDALLLGGACVLCAFGIISYGEVFAGFSSSGVIGLAVLGPISFAIGESGVMEKLMLLMLGTPSSLAGAVPRMMIPVAFLSAFLSNTATVAMMIPIIVSWGQRLDVHPGKLLMPLSFAAQLGGSCTLFGSSHCLVAKGVVDSEIYDMQFFDLFPIGVILCILGTVIIQFVVTKTNLLKYSAESNVKEVELEDGEEEAKEAEGNVYDVKFSVTQLGGLVGKTPQMAGLARLPGVFAVDLEDGKDHTILPKDRAMKAGDIVLAECNEKGVVNLRTVPGLQLMNHKDLVMLGKDRHQRNLYEVILHPDCTIFDSKSYDAENVRNLLSACFVAGPKHAMGESRDDQLIQGGSVLLLEADERARSYVKQADWIACFSLTKLVRNSRPQRHGLPTDQIRNTSTFVAFLVLILLLVLPVGVRLDWGGVLLIIYYLVTDAITYEQVLKACKPAILTTIAAAIAFGTGLSKTGVVNFVAESMLNAVSSMGQVGIVAAVYICAVALSMVINNSATVAILGTMLTAITQKQPDIKIQGLLWCLTYSAGSCFTTPLGYQTNLMVMADGKYTFGDFARFGVFIQLLHMVLTVLLIFLMVPLLVPE